ncbi:MAG: hypothetical protein JXQ75_03920 [Phycisphaerae bacterium]|nr:hypothetical protein [Phycisphaerae bacterium]
MLLILIAAYLGTTPTGTWNDWVTWIPEQSAQAAKQAGQVEAAAQSEGEGGEMEKPAANKGEPVERKLPWLYWGLLGVSAIGALSLIRSRPFSFLITTVLVGLAACCVVVLVGEELSWRPIAFGAAVLGYAIHLGPHPTSMSAVGVVGLVLVVLAGLAAGHDWPQGWPTWSAVGARLGPGPAGFVSNWGQELTWGTILFAAFLGGLCSRTRPIHFLITVLLVALAYHCVMSGKIEIRAFQRSEEGELMTAVYDGLSTEQITVEHEAYSNVAAWRWVAAVELILFAAVLLYKALGMGALSVAFALAWMVLGCWSYGSLRSMSFLGYACRMGAASPIVAVGDSQQVRNPLANMGLPLGPTPAAGQSEPPPRTLRSARVSTATRPDRTAAASTVTAEELARAREAALTSTRQLTWREVGLPIWVYATAILAGIIAITGVHMLFTNEVHRLWLTIALWVTFAVGLTVMWFADPKEPEQSWASWISDWTQSRYKIKVVWLIFLGTLAIVGSWALRPRSQTETWIRASIACVFLGTAMTLVGLALLFYRGGFTPLPVWSYGAIAAGQSALAWILMMQLSLSARRGVARRAPA